MLPSMRMQGIWTAEVLPGALDPECLIPCPQPATSRARQLSRARARAVWVEGSHYAKYADDAAHQRDTERPRNCAGPTSGGAMAALHVCCHVAARATRDQLRPFPILAPVRVCRLRRLEQRRRPWGRGHVSWVCTHWLCRPTSRTGADGLGDGARGGALGAAGLEMGVVAEDGVSGVGVAGCSGEPGASGVAGAGAGACGRPRPRFAICDTLSR